MQSGWRVCGSVCFFFAFLTYPDFLFLVIDNTKIWAYFGTMQNIVPKYF